MNTSCCCCFPITASKHRVAFIVKRLHKTGHLSLRLALTATVYQTCVDKNEMSILFFSLLLLFYCCKRMEQEGAAAVSCSTRSCRQQAAHVQLLSTVTSYYLCCAAHLVCHYYWLTKACTLFDYSSRWANISKQQNLLSPASVQKISVLFMASPLKLRLLQNTFF